MTLKKVMFENLEKFVKNEQTKEGIA